MFLLSTINPFGILWSAFVWGIAGVGVSILVAIPAYGLFSALFDYDTDATNRNTIFVAAVIILIAILCGGTSELTRQQQESYEQERSFLERPVVLYENQLSTKENL